MKKSEDLSQATGTPTQHRHEIKSEQILPEAASAQL